MGKKTIVVYICDWCAANSAPISLNGWPEGWEAIGCRECGTDEVLLCEACFKARKDGMNAVEQERKTGQHDSGL